MLTIFGLYLVTRATVIELAKSITIIMKCCVPRVNDAMHIQIGRRYISPWFWVLVLGSGNCRRCIVIMSAVHLSPTCEFG